MPMLRPRRMPRKSPPNTTLYPHARRGSLYPKGGATMPKPQWTEGELGAKRKHAMVEMLTVRAEDGFVTCVYGCKPKCNVVNIKPQWMPHWSPLDDDKNPVVGGGWVFRGGENRNPPDPFDFTPTPGFEPEPYGPIGFYQWEGNGNPQCRIRFIPLGHDFESVWKRMRFEFAAQERARRTAEHKQEFEPLRHYAGAFAAKRDFVTNILFPADVVEKDEYLTKRQPAYFMLGQAYDPLSRRHVCKIRVASTTIVLRVDVELELQRVGKWARKKYLRGGSRVPTLMTMSVDRACKAAVRAWWLKPA